MPTVASSTVGWVSTCDDHAGAVDTEDARRGGHIDNAEEMVDNARESKPYVGPDRKGRVAGTPS